MQKAFEGHMGMGLNIPGGLVKDPEGNLHYYLIDPYNNIFQVVEDSNFYMKQKSLTGGVAGVVIGVSNIEKAMKVYADILEYDRIVYDKTGQFNDFAALPGGKEKYRRVLLKHKPRTGPFSKLLGPTQIELVQPIERQPDKIFRDRIWGEFGFIHLCFDIVGM
ncbi:VOC family protein, partial [Salinimicrobium sp. CDJ15-91]|nr:VOC family protein [Salinimicrobium oceani]